MKTGAGRSPSLDVGTGSPLGKLRPHAWLENSSVDSFATLGLQGRKIVSLYCLSHQFLTAAMGKEPTPAHSPYCPVTELCSFQGL